jgi:hypothetical protein
MVHARTLMRNLGAPGGAGNDERDTTPTIPTTIRTTPTTGRLAPLSDAGTANFKIAPTAINTKRDPILISRTP